MAFPSLVGSAGITTQTSAADPILITLPTGKQVGEGLLIFFYPATVANTWSFPAGYTVILNEVTPSGGAATKCRLIIAYKEIDGTEGTTCSVDGSATSLAIALAVRVSGQAPAAQTPIRIASFLDITNIPYPPNLVADGGNTADFLWLAGCGQDNNINPSTDPANYTRFSQVNA